MNRASQMARSPRDSNTPHRNFSWVLLGSICYAAAQFLTLSIITKICGAKGLGQYGFALALATPVFLFLGLELRTVLATDTCARNRTAEFLTLRSIGILLSVAISLGAALVVAPDYASIVVAVCASKASESLADVLYGHLQRKQNMRPIGISRVMRAAATTTALAATLSATASLPIALGAHAMASATVLLYDLRIAFKDKPGRHQPSHVRHRIDTGALVSLAKLALPLGIVATIDTLNVNVPRYFLQGTVGDAGVGIYSGLLSLVLASGIVVTTAHSVFLPRLALAYDNGPATHKRETSKLIAAALIAGVALILMAVLFGKPLIEIVFNKEFAHHQASLMVLSCGGALWIIASMATCALQSARVYATQLWIYGAMLFISLLGCTIFVPKLGVMGSAVAYTLGMLTRAALSMIVLRSTWNRHTQVRPQAVIS